MIVANIVRHRQVPPNPPPPLGSQLKKRKEPDSDLPPPVNGNASTKQTKTSNPGGLVTNWKQSVGLLKHIANKHPIDFFDDEDVMVKGEFDNVKGLNMLNAVRASKPSTVKIEFKTVSRMIMSNWSYLPTVQLVQHQVHKAPYQQEHTPEEQ